MSFGISWLIIVQISNKQILMSKTLNSLRQRYQQVRNYAYNNDMKKVDRNYIAKFIEDGQKQMQRMQRTNNFDNLQEVDFYQDKFSKLQSALNNAARDKVPMKDYVSQVKQIFKQKSFTSRNSYLSQPPNDPKLTSQPPIQSKVIKSFFEEKRSKIVPQVGFRSLLENPPVSPKNFKKRIGANNDEIARLRSQNQELRRKLEIGNYNFTGKQLQVQIRKQQQRIRFLQSQNERLSRDNTKLKSQRSVTVNPSLNAEDYLYTPYVLNPRENDLLKISMRTSDIDSTSYYNQNFDGNQVHYQKSDYMLGNSPSFNSKQPNQFKMESMSEIGDTQGYKDRYSIFDMNKSRFSEYGTNDANIQLSNGSSGIQDSRTAQRNKMAFFRNSGILVRENDFQIAYKRSENTTLDSNRIYLYFNNKINRARTINVYYEYENNYYQLNNIEILKQINGLKQGREVVEVRLINHNDINSVIEANIQIDGKRFKLWLPAVFMRIHRPRNNGLMQNNSRKTVYPSKIFSNEIEAEKVIENLQIASRGQGNAWGSSPVHEGPIKLSWKSGNKLQIQTSPKWIDFLSFLMFDYR